MPKIKLTEEEDKKRITGEELRLLYSAILNDIQFIKKQQVEITNYVAGIFIAIVFLFDLISNDVGFVPRLKLILIIVSFFVMASGILYLFKLERDLQESRNQKDRAIKEFSEGFKEVLGFKGGGSNFWFFVIAIALGEFLVFIFLWVY